MKILLNNDVAIKLKYYTELAKGEISGMGKVEKTEDGDILITDIVLFDQECTSTTTYLDDGAQAKFMEDMRVRGESLKDWTLWWHTHDDMGVFWSSTDDTTVKENFDSGVLSHLVSIVTNKKGEFKGRLDIQPVDSSEFGVIILPLTVDLDVEVVVDEEKQEEYDKTVELIDGQIDETIEILKDLRSQKDSANDYLVGDETVLEECKAEVADKVRDKVYKNNTSVNILDYCKKKTVDEEIGQADQRYFEETLEDITLGFKSCHPEHEYSDSFDDEYDDEESCPECQNPILYCCCANAIEKWKDKLVGDDGFSDYTETRYKNIINNI